MHYFAALSRKYGCTGILEIDDDTYNENVEAGAEYENEFCIRLDSYRDDLEYQKKYINGEWIPAKPSDFECNTNERLIHMPDDMWLNKAIGNLSDLSAQNPDGDTSLVYAINYNCTDIKEIQAQLVSLEEKVAALESGSASTEQ